MRTGDFFAFLPVKNVSSFEFNTLSLFCNSIHHIVAKDDSGLLVVGKCDCIKGGSR